MQSPPLSFLNLTLLDPGALITGAAAQVVESIQPLALGHLLCHLALRAVAHLASNGLVAGDIAYLGPKLI